MECSVLCPTLTKPIPIGQVAASPPRVGSLSAACSWGSRPIGSFEGSLSGAEFGRHGSTAEITSLIVSNVKHSPIPEELSGLLHAKHPGSRASLCSFVSEQLVGSGRGSVAEMTSLVVSELSPPTEEQLWRQQSVAGSVVVFVTAGYAGKRFVFEIAQQMELSVVIIDAADSWSRGLKEEGVIEKFIPMDIGELDSSFDICVQKMREVKEELGRLDAVVSFSELAQPLVARLAEHFKLPGNSFVSVTAARDKYLSREAFVRAGLPTPKYYLIKDIDHCDAAADHVGFPAVIKPVSGAASIGVVRVDSLEDLRRRVQDVRTQLLHARVVNGALQEGAADDDTTGTDAAAWIDLTIMMEQYLDGPEVDIDVIIADGVSSYESLTDNWPTIEPYFNETGSNCPSILPSHQQKELRDLAVASIQALGLTTGVFHVEAKYTSHGARLIEVNCRMGGGPVQLINRLVYGVDLVVEQLILSCGGDPMERRENPEPLCNLAEYSMNCPRSGYIAHTNFLDKWNGHPHLVYARPLVQPLQRVIGPGDGMPSWLCEVMCTASSVEEGIQFLKDMEKQIEFPIVDILPVIGDAPVNEGS
eukprot:EG_transcript_4723